jgi:hypothetical protein
MASCPSTIHSSRPPSKATVKASSWSPGWKLVACARSKGGGRKKFTMLTGRSTVPAVTLS